MNVPSKMKCVGEKLNRANGKEKRNKRTNKQEKSDKRTNKKESTFELIAGVEQRGKDKVREKLLRADITGRVVQAKTIHYT